MAPTILPGDRITVNKLVKSFPKRNDVVVFYSEGPGSELGNACHWATRRDNFNFAIRRIR